mmetsp:Transcript_4042/g.4133  ORF Transcript_4042/g.4133 Transcript_4042/m.4133 type:complete len:106 (-) Transcript_4042:421-738(-)
MSIRIAFLFVIMLAVGSARRWPGVPSAFLKPIAAEESIAIKGTKFEGEIPSSSVPQEVETKASYEDKWTTSVDSMMKVWNPCPKKDTTVLGRYFCSMTSYGAFRM